MRDFSRVGKLFTETSLLPHTTYYEKKVHTKKNELRKKPNLQALIDSYPGVQLEKKCN